jgi:hypothetical protein
VSAAAEAAACAQASSSTCVKNAPVAAGGSYRHQQQQQQHEDRPHASSVAARPGTSLPLASVGSSGSPGSSSSSILQQHPHGYSGPGPSRFGPGSVPNSPGKGSSPCTTLRL